MGDANAKYDARIQEKVWSHLGPGESILAVTAVEQAGRNKGGHLIEKVARIGANAVKNRKAREQAEAAGFPFGTRMVLVATQGRLLVFNQSPGSRVADSDDFAMPAEFLGEVPYDHLYAAQGQNAQAHNGYVKRAGWVVFRLLDGETYQLSSWGNRAENFGILVDRVLATRR